MASADSGLNFWYVWKRIQSPWRRSLRSGGRTPDRSVTREPRPTALDRKSVGHSRTSPDRSRS